MVPFALKVKPIFDGTPKSDKDDVSFRSVPKVTYVTLPKSLSKVKEGTHQLYKALARPSYRALNGLTLALIPKFKKNANPRETGKTLCMLQKHKAVLAAIGRVMVPEVINLDHQSEALGITCCQAIMEITCLSNSKEKVVLCADTLTWGDGGMALTYQKAHDDLCPILSYLPVLLWQKHGEEAAAWLTPEGLQMAHETHWDKATNLPITEDENSLELANDDAPQWVHQLNIENIELVAQNNNRDEDNYPLDRPGCKGQRNAPPDDGQQNGPPDGAQQNGPPDGAQQKATPQRNAPLGNATWHFNNQTACSELSSIAEGVEPKPMDVSDDKDRVTKTSGRSVSFVPTYNPEPGKKEKERATAASTSAINLSKVRESLRDMMKGPKSGSSPDMATRL